VTGAWAERRRIEQHQTTGALQIVEIRERVELAAAPPAYVQQGLPLDAPVPPSLVFAALTTADLLSVGVPTDWLGDVAGATEEGFFALAGHLPKEASEGLLEYLANGVLAPAPPPVVDPLEHPDTQRRFRVLEGADELQAALDAPFEQWTVFLHPTQRGVVVRDFSGPARVAGSAGTGKTVVALHRVLRLLQNDANAQVLLTTFSEPLARSLTGKLKLLFGDRPGLLDRVNVASFLEIAAQLYTLLKGRKAHMAVHDVIRSLLGKAAADLSIDEFTPQFLYSEWTHVIDAWQIDTSRPMPRCRAWAARTGSGRGNGSGSGRCLRRYEKGSPIAC
jgi:hypothetical protein